MAFVRSDAAPAGLRDAALVALHGSWNRTKKDGYKVVSLHWRADGTIEERDFMTGFERDGDVIGRPVDVIEGPDGAFYVSDDYAGSIYRVTAKGAEAETAAAPSRPTPPPQQVSAGELAARGERGAALFESNACYACHEPGRTTPGVVVKPIAGLSKRYSLDDLAAFLAAPTPPMPVVPLSPEERLDLAAYLLTASP
jgi:cytochrome c553